MIFHIVNARGSNDPRLARARATWEVLYKSEKVTPVAVDTAKSARDIGDPRDLPWLRIALGSLPKGHDDGPDIYMLTNDDVRLAPELPEVLKDVLAGQAAVCSFRVNLPDGKPDYGRDLFAFTHEWLRDNPLPDMLLGEIEWDIIVTYMIRRSVGAGISNRTKQLHALTKAELPLGLVLHERHEAGWQRPEFSEAAGKVWNRLQARRWYAENNLKHLCTI